MQENMHRSYKNGIIYHIINFYIILMKHVTIIAFMLACWYSMKGTIPAQYIMYVLLIGIVSLIMHYYVIIRCIRFNPNELLGIYKKELGSMSIESLETLLFKYYGACSRSFVGCHIRLPESRFTGGRAVGNMLELVYTGFPTGRIEGVIKRIDIRENLIVVSIG